MQEEEEEREGVRGAPRCMTVCVLWDVLFLVLI